MRFYSISIFQDSVDELKRRPKNNYASCLIDLAETLKDKSFDDIFRLGDVIFNDGQNAIRKLRFKNSDMREGARSGFRIYIWFDLANKNIIFLDIYPKKGTLAKSTLTHSELVAVMKAYREELLGEQLLELDFECAFEKKGHRVLNLDVGESIQSENEQALNSPSLSKES